jgi:hypothetical protein
MGRNELRKQFVQADSNRKGWGDTDNVHDPRVSKLNRHQRRGLKRNADGSKK